MGLVQHQYKFDLGKTVYLRSDVICKAGVFKKGTEFVVLSREPSIVFYRYDLMHTDGLTLCGVGEYDLSAKPPFRLFGGGRK